MGLADGIFQGLLAAFLYAIPALSIHLLVSGLADPRNEGWEAPPKAAAWKATYRRYARWALHLNLFLLALFLIEALMFIVLSAADCDLNASHTTAAARNIAEVTDVAYLIGFIVLVGLGIAALAWSVAYLGQAKRNEWADPRRRDMVFVHAIFVPLSLLLLIVAFGVVPRMICPSLLL